MRKMLFGLIVLLALLLAAEVGVTLLSQRGMERAMRSQYGLPPSLEVAINSFPFLVSLARNHLGELQLSWEGELVSRTEEGEEANPPYQGKVNLYDVELNMPALLRGRLEIRSISRSEACFFLDQESLGAAFGLDRGFLSFHNGGVFATFEGRRVEYEVEIVGDDTVALNPVSGSINDADMPHGPQPVIQPPRLRATFEGLPLGAALQSASLHGDRMAMRVSIPMWEGYM